MTIRVDERGVITCDRCKAAFEAAMLLLPTGMATQVYLVQGSFSGAVSVSGGTHNGCGVVDISRFRADGVEWTWDELCQIAAVLRAVGFFAWPREAIPGVWARHIHIGLCNCPDLSSAAQQQQRDYEAGRDGLLPRGRDGLSVNPDVFDRTHVGVIWETYQQENGFLMSLSPDEQREVLDSVRDTHLRVRGNSPEYADHDVLQGIISQLNHLSGDVLNAAVPWIDPDTGQASTTRGMTLAMMISYFEDRSHRESQRVIDFLKTQPAVAQQAIDPVALAAEIVKDLTPLLPTSVDTKAVAAAIAASLKVQVTAS